MTDDAAVAQLDALADQAEEAGNVAEDALPYWQELVRQAEAPALAASEDALARWIYAQNTIVLIHAEAGRDGEAYALASATVDAAFDRTPDDAAGAMANLAFWVAEEDRRKGREREAVALADRVVERLGADGAGGRLRTRAIAHLIAGHALQGVGDHDLALQRFTRVVEGVDGAGDAELRGFVAEAQYRKGLCAFDLGRFEQTEAIFRGIVRAYAGDDQPAVAGVVAEAEAWLAENARRPRHRLRLRRRGS